eukprot:CAMPEP_0196656402 /NCGR_PEP_ID=MMETSP1086-20130531/16737_1 /TAXON_ID=77921 /ORGANISM="Cyanoptyche  gloeocystis , Strain SAG4.97" /LENGTH=55 /DNA_ID=CAMNT_0041989139 /DNA_START=77 /DNA_END=240 /DNA_ORIENTATION=-
MAGRCVVEMLRTSVFIAHRSLQQGQKASAPYKFRHMRCEDRRALLVRHIGGQAAL